MGHTTQAIKRENQHRSARRILRATALDEAVARTLIEEYCDLVGVVQRDTPDALRALLGAGTTGSGLWIAYVGSAPVGCVALRPLARFDAAGECKRLYVRAAFRQRGVASALLDALETHAQVAGLRTIYLDSKDDLEAAIALYLRCGYQPCERYNDNLQATIFLRKTLPVANR